MSCAICALLLSASLASAPALTLTNAGNRAVIAGSSVTNIISAAGAAPAIYIRDTFTGANNTALPSHLPDVGGAWANEQGTNVVRLSSNRVRTTLGAAESRVSNATAPATADYDVSMDIIWSGSTSTSRIGIQGRSSGAQLRGAGYIAQYNALNNRWELGKYVSSSLVTLGTSPQTYVAGQTHNLRLGMAGTAITLYVDGVARISVTDGTIAAAGRTGIYFSVSGNDSSSLMGDNYLVSSPGLGPATATFSTSGLPANSTAAFAPASCTLDCSTTLTVTTQVSTPPGTYPVTISGTAAGSTATTTFNLTVTRDTTPPAVSISSPAPGAVVQNTITVSATASDNLGIAGVQFRLDGSNLGPEDTTVPYAVSWNTTTATNGPHTLTAVARDVANNLTPSAGVTVTVNNPVPDTQAPTIPTGLTAAPASLTQIDLNWNASTDNVGVTGYEIFRNGVMVASIAGTAYRDGSLAPNTRYMYVVSAFDAAANRSGLSTPASVTTPADTKAPAVSITFPANGSTVAGVVSITAAAIDNLGIAGVQFFLDEAPLGPEDTTAPYSTTWNTAQSAAGRHKLLAYARDMTGHTTESFEIVVTVATGPFALNHGGSRTVVQGSSVANSLLATRTGTASATMAFSVSGLPLHSSAAVTPQSCSLDCAATLTIATQNNTPLGTYPVTVIGAIGADIVTATFDLTITPLAPDSQAPAVSITSPPDGATLYGTIAVTATASDNTGVVGVQFKVDGVNLGAEDIFAPYSASWDASSVSGTHTLTAVARDGAGNVATSAPVLVTIDNTQTRPGCQFLTATPPVAIAFCEDLSRGAAPGGRAGELDDERWSVGRIVGNFNGTNLLAFPRTPVSACKSGVESVDADGDLMVCDSASGHEGQLLTALSAQNYGLLSMRPRQVFDFTGRTGTISFNVDAVTRGILSWWTSVFVTDEPIPGANNTLKVTGEVPKNGVGVNFDGNDCSDNSGGEMRVNSIFTFANYVELQIPVNNSVCVLTRRGMLNHIEIRLSQTDIEIWASDYSTDDGQTFPNFRLIAAAPINLSFTKGYVHFQQEERAPIKYGFNPWYSNNYWSDLGFDGPVAGKETAYAVPDALTRNPGVGGGDGYYMNALNIGYGLLTDPNSTYTCCTTTGQTTAVGPFPIPGVNLAGVTSARLTFSITYWPYDVFTASRIVTKYRLNGGPWKFPTPTPNYAAALNGGQWMTGEANWAVGFSFAVAVSDLINGTNTLEIGSDGTSNAYPPILANIDLLTYK